MNYSAWETGLANAERSFLRRLDHRVWVRAAAQFETPADGPILRERSEDGDELVRKLSEVPDFASDFDATRRLFLRLFRYQSSETLISLIVSSQKNIPYLRFVHKEKHDNLTAIFCKIRDGGVPTNYRVDRRGNPLTFREWLQYKITGCADHSICDTLVAFIKQEAKLLSDRSALNALKHGRAAVNLSNDRIGLDIEHDGKRVNLIKDRYVIHFEEWTEKRISEGIGYAYTRGFESVDPDYDLAAIITASLLMNTIRGVRLELLGDDIQSHRLPKDVALEAGMFRAKGVPVPNEN